MNQMEIFKNPEFGSIRVIEENGKYLFCGTDVAAALGYSNPRDAIIRHCRYVVKRDAPHPQSPDRKISMTFIPEGDLYRLIVHSKLPSAERFEQWVFDEVLPTIRKHGAYLTKEKLWEVATSPEALMKLCSDLLAEREANISLRKENAQLEGKAALLNLPYLLMGLFATNFGEAWRLAQGANASEKFLSLFAVLPGALQSFWPSLHPLDLLVGLCCGAGLRLAVYLKSKNAKKYRHGMEYGSARWGTREDIAPYIDPVFQNNVILTKTESLTMNSRPKDPKTARNKNVLVIGGSGSGKTRFWLKPNLMQMHSSYVVTDPKGTILVECGKMLQRGAPKLGKDGKPMKDKHGKVIYEPYRIKVLNTINFRKSMHYNPFAYIHSEKDILKLVTTLIANTKGEGKAGDDFWVKAETLLYCALIGYIHYEAPVEEQNFSTLIEFINAMEVREDDEEFKNPVDLMFDALEAEKPNHFAVRQYKKYKLAAGDICSK